MGNLARSSTIFPSSAQPNPTTTGRDMTLADIEFLATITIIFLVLVLPISAKLLDDWHKFKDKHK